MTDSDDEFQQDCDGEWTFTYEVDNQTLYGGWYSTKKDAQEAKRAIDEAIEATATMWRRDTFTI